MGAVRAPPAFVRPDRGPAPIPRRKGTAAECGGMGLYRCGSTGLREPASRALPTSSADVCIRAMPLASPMALLQDRVSALCYNRVSASYARAS